MIVRMLGSLGGEPPHAYGDLVDVADDIGAVWITEGLAEAHAGDTRTVAVHPAAVAPAEPSAPAAAGGDVESVEQPSADALKTSEVS